MEDSSARDRRSRHQVSSESVCRVCEAAVNGSPLRWELVLTSEVKEEALSVAAALAS